MDLENINMYIEGEGQAMLLLHGWGMSHQMMEPLYAHFKNEYKVCNLDLPGFGESALPPYAYCIEDYVNVIRKIIKQYDLDNPIIIAHSFGARIAFYYAALFPVKQLIITGGSGIRPPRTFDYYFKVYLFKTLRLFHIKNDLGSDDYKNASEVMRHTLVKVVNEDASDEIAKITCPLFLVWGEKDKETPLWMAHKIEQLNDNATLVVFKEDDHFAYYHQMHRFIKICEHVLEGGK